jgi:hypothetical protein
MVLLDASSAILYAATFANAFQETIPPMTGTHYKGRLDQVAFWNSELTRDQIEAQFKALPRAWLPFRFPARFNWELMLPVNSAGGFANPPHVVEHAQLNAAFKYVDCTKKYFYMGTDGTMVFQVPSNGARDGQWPRSEFRGTKADGEEDNWVPDNSTHTLAGTCRIMDNAVGKIIIGQIHAETDPDGPDLPLKPLPAITLYVNYTVSPSFLEVAVYDTPTTAIGSPGHHRLVPDLVNVALDTDIKYELKLMGTGNSVTLQVKVWYDGETTPRTVNVTMDPSWLGDELYYKAGCYYNNTVSGVDAKVTFSSLSTTP